MRREPDVDFQALIAKDLFLFVKDRVCELRVKAGDGFGRS